MPTKVPTNVIMDKKRREQMDKLVDMKNTEAEIQFEIDCIQAEIEEYENNIGKPTHSEWEEYYYKGLPRPWNGETRRSKSVKARTHALWQKRVDAEIKAGRMREMDLGL